MINVRLEELKLKGNSPCSEDIDALWDEAVEKRKQKALHTIR